MFEEYTPAFKYLTCLKQYQRVKVQINNKEKKLSETGPTF